MSSNSPLHPIPVSSNSGLVQFALSSNSRLRPIPVSSNSVIIPPVSYRELDPARIIATAQTLSNRIAERFPDSDLKRVSQELLAVAREAEGRLQRMRAPHWPLRLLAFLGLALLIAVVATAAVSLRIRADVGGWSEFMQGVDAIINDIVFAGAAVFFLFTLEIRRKRRDALIALHELRSIAHIVDMHQLTKDPEIVLSPEKPTRSSPARPMTRFELSRYLDYCSELLAITSKLAALHAQYLNDPVVLDAVNGVQELTYGLSGKIWQKIMILDTVTVKRQ